MKRKITSILIALACAFGMSACASSTANTRNYPNVSVEEHKSYVDETLNTLNKAHNIRLKKDLISWGDHWTVYVDGEAVGYVHGKPIRFLEVYELTNLDGVVIASEEENWKVINSTANLKDWQGNQTGRIEQEVFSMLAKLRIYRDDQQVGNIQQKLDLGINAEIATDNDGEWKLKGKIIIAGADLTLTRLKDNTEVTPLEAIWSSLILHEITSTSSENSSSQRNK